MKYGISYKSEKRATLASPFSQQPDKPYNRIQSWYLFHITFVVVPKPDDEPFFLLRQVFSVTPNCCRNTDNCAQPMLGEHASLASMGTLFEDSCTVFLDSVIAELMTRLEVSEEAMKGKHTTIE